MELIHLNSENFDESINEKDTPVLVDFFATWCGPCRMLAPILEDVSSELEGKAKVYKVDIDECMDIAKRFGIMSVPTMIIFKEGKEIDRLIGLRQKNQIIDALK